MKYFKHWAVLPVMVSRQGRDFSVSIKGHSNISQNDAVKNAESQKGSITREILENRYETERGILMEEVINEIEGHTNPIIITRNRYGSLVLNAADIIFTDHDINSAYTFFPMSFLPLFFLGRRNKEKSGLLESIRASFRKNDLSGRIYETRNGYRCIVTNKCIPGGTKESIKLLKKLGCDYQYVLMTKLQQCYRTRLTPKPFRMKLPKPPIKFPYATPKSRELFDEWLTVYNTKSESYATCKFIEEIGSVQYSRISKLVEAHDKASKCMSDLPLA